MNDVQAAGRDDIRKIGLFGGTFDPVHTGHLVIAEIVREQAGLDVVLFIPAANPPHKNHVRMFDTLQRFNMVKAATSDNPLFLVSDIELRRQGPSFTVDTVTRIKSEIPAGTELHFIVGKDNLYEMGLWKNPREIARELDSILVADRIAHDNRPVPEWLNDKVNMISVPLIEISSSDIRQRIKTGKSIKYMVPKVIEEEIARYISDAL